MSSSYDNTSDDPQGTTVASVSPEDFDVDAYALYEAGLLERNRRFWEADSAVAVYRRFRVPACFRDLCRDPRASLAAQLGALQASMAYPADIANFLEPWYGIGALASAFGVDYEWPAGQAPVVPHAFGRVEELLEREPVPIDQTPIGQRILAMIDYFVEATEGRLPISLTDTQSPLNALSFLVDSTAFYTAFIDAPEALATLLDRLVPLQVDFVQRQRQRLGQALVWPGHGFASSRAFHGLGMSDDVMTLLSPDQVRQFDLPSLTACGRPFGGPVVHSCGRWVDKLNVIQSIDGLVMVDAALTPQTDPDPNEAKAFRKAFSGTGVVVNARMVGDAETVIQTVKSLWQPPMKLIVVTYCRSPEEQATVYQAVHEICQS